MLEEMKVAALQASELTSGMITRFTAWILIVAIVLIKRVPLTSKLPVPVTATPRGPVFS